MDLVTRKTIFSLQNAGVDGARVREGPPLFNPSALLTVLRDVGIT